jgi:hypothetical protein
MLETRNVMAEIFSIVGAIRQECTLTLLSEAVYVVFVIAGPCVGTKRAAFESGPL